MFPKQTFSWLEVPIPHALTTWKASKPYSFCITLTLPCMSSSALTLSPVSTSTTDMVCYNMRVLNLCCCLKLKTNPHCIIERSQTASYRTIRYISCFPIFVYQRDVLFCVHESWHMCVFAMNQWYTFMYCKWEQPLHLQRGYSMAQLNHNHPAQEPIKLDR